MPQKLYFSIYLSKKVRRRKLKFVTWKKHFFQKIPKMLSRRDYNLIQHCIQVQICWKCPKLEKYFFEFCPLAKAMCSPNFASTNTRSNVSFFQPPALDLRHGELLGYYIGYKATNSAEPFRYQTLEVNATTAAIVDFASLVYSVLQGGLTGCRTRNGGKLSNSWFDCLTWLCLGTA